MKIAISKKPLTTDSKTRGVGVYARELLAALTKHYPDDSYLMGDKDNYKLDPDLVHFPFFDPFFLTLPLYKTKPTIVTIHDCITLRFPEHFPRGIRGELKLRIQKKSLTSVAHVITDSEASKVDITKYLSVPSDKISVIPLAPATSRTTATIKEDIKKEYQLPARYLLYVGDINWNKNLPGLIRAFTKLANPRLHLLLVGKVYSDKPDIPEFRNLMSTIRESSMANNIRLIGYVPTHHLPYLYQHATLYVQPSWYEGFGLTVLEAMRQGCPVLSSNQGSLPEVGGDSVCYFDPHSDKQFVDTLKDLLAKSNKRKKYAKLGLARSKQFSWEQTAKLTHEVYEKILASTN